MGALQNQGLQDVLALLDDRSPGDRAGHTSLTSKTLTFVPDAPTEPYPLPRLDP
jgi:hypothetical protein